MLATKNCIGTASYETLYQYARKHIHSQPVYALPRDARQGADPCWSWDHKLLVNELLPMFTKVRAPKEEGHMDALRLLIPTPVSSSLALDFYGTLGIQKTYPNGLITGFYFPPEIDSLVLWLGGDSCEWISSECTYTSNEELLVNERLVLQSCSTRRVSLQELQLERSTYSHLVFNSEDRITIDGEPYARCQLFHPFFPACLLSLFRGRITLPVQCLVYIEIAVPPTSCLEAITFEYSPSVLWSLMKDRSIPKPLDADPFYFCLQHLSDTKTIAVRKGYSWIPDLYFLDKDDGVCIVTPDVTLFEPVYRHL